MCDLVDARLPRSRRVALAYRDQYKGRILGFLVAGEDRSPLASALRNVELYTALEGAFHPGFHLRNGGATP